MIYFEHDYDSVLYNNGGVYVHRAAQTGNDGFEIPAINVLAKASYIVKDGVIDFESEKNHKDFYCGYTHRCPEICKDVLISGLYSYGDNGAKLLSFKYGEAPCTVHPGQVRGPGAIDDNLASQGPNQIHVNVTEPHNASTLLYDDTIVFKVKDQEGYPIDVVIYAPTKYRAT